MYQVQNAGALMDMINLGFQFKKGDHTAKRDFVQITYFIPEVFSAESKKCCTIVSPSGKNL